MWSTSSYLDGEATLERGIDIRDGQGTRDVRGHHLAVAEPRTVISGGRPASSQRPEKGERRPTMTRGAARGGEGAASKRAKRNRNSTEPAAVDRTPSESEPAANSNAAPTTADINSSNATRVKRKGGHGRGVRNRTRRAPAKSLALGRPHRPPAGRNSTRLDARRNREDFMVEIAVICRRFPRWRGVEARGGAPPVST